jgi:hypothetical protein
LEDKEMDVFSSEEPVVIQLEQCKPVCKINVIPKTSEEREIDAS